MNIGLDTAQIDFISLVEIQMRVQLFQEFIFRLLQPSFYNEIQILKVECYYEIYEWLYIMYQFYIIKVLLLLHYTIDGERAPALPVILHTYLSLGASVEQATASLIAEINAAFASKEIKVGVPS